MNPTFPLQSNTNCVACAFAAALEVALSRLPPEYHRRVTPAEIAAIVGAPADVARAAAQLQTAYPWAKTFPVTEGYPQVVATWRDDFGHALALLDAHSEYDPGKGGRQATYGRDKMALHHGVFIHNPPVVNKWRKYWLYRAFERLFGLEV